MLSILRVTTLLLQRRGATELCPHEYIFEANTVRGSKVSRYAIRCRLSWADSIRSVSAWKYAFKMLVLFTIDRLHVARGRDIVAATIFYSADARDLYLALKRPRPHERTCKQARYIC